MATYAWFSLWLLLTIFMGMGIFTLLSRLIKPMVVNVLLLDGSVRAVTNSVDSIVWRAAGTRAGREVGMLPN